MEYTRISWVISYLYSVSIEIVTHILCIRLQTQNSMLIVRPALSRDISWDYVLTYSYMQLFTAAVFVCLKD